MSIIIQLGNSRKIATASDTLQQFRDNVRSLVSMVGKIGLATLFIGIISNTGQFGPKVVSKYYQ